MESLLAECQAWDTVAWDASDGVMPQHATPPWNFTTDETTLVSLVTVTGPDDYLRIGAGLNLATVGAEFSRDEPALGAGGSSLFLIQSRYRFSQSALPIDITDYTVAFVGAETDDVAAYYSFQFIDDLPHVVLGDTTTPTDLSNSVPFTLRAVPSTSLLVVDRGEQIHLAIDGSPTLSRSYATLPPPARLRTGFFGFAGANLTSEYYEVAYCICTDRSAEIITGSKEKITVSNVSASPNPFDPDIQTSKLSLTLGVLNLPGGSSAKFEYLARTSWTIKSDTGGIQRTLVSAQPVEQIGGLVPEAFWDGTDDNAAPVPDGAYEYSVTAELVRTKKKDGKTKVVDAITVVDETILVSRATPIPPPTEPASPGIQVTEILAAGLGDGCFQVAFEYVVTPTAAPGQQPSIEIQYTWNDHFYEVEGLAPRTTLTITPDQTFIATETVDVCPRDPAQHAHIFRFGIEATGAVDWFSAFPVATYYRGSENWATNLLAPLNSLKQLIQDGNDEPEILRAYWLVQR